LDEKKKYLTIAINVALQWRRDTRPATPTPGTAPS